MQTISHVWDRIRHFQIYKTAKILPLMHILSGSQRKKCFTKIKGVEGEIGKHGIQKKDDTT